MNANICWQSIALHFKKFKIGFSKFYILCNIADTFIVAYHLPIGFTFCNYLKRLLLTSAMPLNLCIFITVLLCEMCSVHCVCKLCINNIDYWLAKCILWNQTSMSRLIERRKLLASFTPHHAHMWSFLLNNHAGVIYTDLHTLHASQRGEFRYGTLVFLFAAPSSGL